MAEIVIADINCDIRSLIVAVKKHASSEPSDFTDVSIISKLAFNDELLSDVEIDEASTLVLSLTAQCKKRPEIVKSECLQHDIVILLCESQSIGAIQGVMLMCQRILLSNPQWTKRLIFCCPPMYNDVIYKNIRHIFYFNNVNEYVKNRQIYRFAMIAKLKFLLVHMPALSSFINIFRWKR